MQYVSNTMSYEELKDISKELFSGVLDHQIAVSLRNYCDFQERFLSVSENGEVMICNAYTKDRNTQISCGNILTDSIDSIIYKKYHHKHCKDCISMGLTLAKGYDCKVFPDYYYSIMKENEYLKDAFSEPKEKKDAKFIENEMEKEILFMHTVRSWEEAYDDKIQKRLLPMISELSFDKASEIVKKYCRFPDATWERLSCIVSANTSKIGE